MFRKESSVPDNSPASLDNKKIKLINILDYKIGYFPIPKTACTSIKQALYLVDQGTNYSNEKDGRGGIHRYFNKNTREEQCDRFEFSFVVVRDPIKRFLSAYSNRVTHHKELSHRYITRKFPKFADQLPYFDPGLGQFIDNFSQYFKIRPIKHHTQPVSHSLTKTNLQQFSKIYCMENLPSLEYDLSAIHGHDLKLERLQTGGRKIPLRDLSQQQMEFLLDYYQEDYELLSDSYTVEKIWEEWAGDSKCNPVIHDTP